ncbi:MAG: RNA 3'-terminal phosphate cyclase, partial [Acidobacteriota bacterium]
MIEIDGSIGEGGGQILRSCLSLSMATQQPFRIHRIRGGRRRPGLLRQHLTGVLAAAEICGADLEGAELGSVELSFHPGRVRGGEFRFAVGTAGSAHLVLQAILPALLHANVAAQLRLEGGTHNPSAPPYPFVERTFLPRLRQLGYDVDVQLERHGFYPAGGGAIVATVRPAARLEKVSWRERGELFPLRAEIVYAKMPREIPERQAQILSKKLGVPSDEVRLAEVESLGPGNAVMIDAASESGVEVVTAFGESGVASEKILRRAANQVRRLQKSSAPIGEFLADQLLLPLALGPGGVF